MSWQHHHHHRDRHHTDDTTEDPALAELLPLGPSDLGLAPVVVETGQVETVHLLADEARPDLVAAGFADDEIDEWARQLVVRRGPGGEDDLVVFIRDAEERLVVGPT